MSRQQGTLVWDFRAPGMKRRGSKFQRRANGSHIRETRNHNEPNYTFLSRALKARSQGSIVFQSPGPQYDLDIQIPSQLSIKCGRRQAWMGGLRTCTFRELLDDLLNKQREETAGEKMEKDFGVREPIFEKW